jgi:hypothetical protein
VANNIPLDAGRLEPIAGLIESGDASGIMVNTTADQHPTVFVERRGCVGAVSDVSSDLILPFP